MLLVVGCGGAEAVERLSPKAEVARAASATKEAGSSLVAFELTMRGAGLPRALRMTGEGAFDYERRVGRLALDMGDFAELAEGSALGDPSLWRIHAIAQRDALYLSVPLLNAVLPGAPEWVRFDVAALAKTQGIDLEELQSLAWCDPAQSLDYLRATAGAVRQVGVEEVRGVETTHYRGTVDLERALRLAPPKLRARVRALRRQLPADRIPTDVWVDGDGLARRIRQSFSAEVAPGRTLRSQVTMELYDFGTEVEVQPPLHGVVDFERLLAKGGGG